MTSNELYDQIIELAESFKVSGAKFKEKGVKQGAKDARKASLAMEKLGKEYRKLSVLDEKK